MCACHFLLNHLQIVFAQNSMQNILYSICAKHTVFHTYKTTVSICKELWQTLQVWEVKGSTGISHFTVHHFFFFIYRSRISYDSSIYSASLYCAYRYYFCLFLKVATLHCINLLAPSPIAFANFMFLSHILVIFEIFQTFLLYLYGDL